MLKTFTSVSLPLELSRVKRRIPSSAQRDEAKFDQSGGVHTALKRSQSFVGEIELMLIASRDGETGREKKRKRCRRGPQLVNSSRRLFDQLGAQVWNTNGLLHTEKKKKKKSEKRMV